MRLLIAAALTIAASLSYADAPKIVSIDEVDCSKVKGYIAQKECMVEQQKGKALTEQVNNITDSTGKRFGDRLAHIGSGHFPIAQLPTEGITCERYHTRVADHNTITITDASFTISDKANIYVYVMVKNNYGEEDIPKSYTTKLLPRTFAAVMTDGKRRNLGEGEWLGDDIRVHGDKEYKVRFYINNPDAEAVANLVCLN